MKCSFLNTAEGTRLLGDNSGFFRSSVPSPVPQSPHAASLHSSHEAWWRLCQFRRRDLVVSLASSAGAAGPQQQCSVSGGKGGHFPSL